MKFSVEGLVAAVGPKTSRDLYQKVTFVPDDQFVRRRAFASKNETIRPFGRNSTRDCARSRSKFHTRLHADVKMKRFGLFIEIPHEIADHEHAPLQIDILWIEKRVQIPSTYPTIFLIRPSQIRSNSKRFNRTLLHQWSLLTLEQLVAIHVCVCVCTRSVSLSHTHMCVSQYESGDSRDGQGYRPGQESQDSIGRWGRQRVHTVEHAVWDRWDQISTLAPPARK
jgi:hypothetical protein